MWREAAAEIAVGEDADQRTVAIDDAEAAETLGGHHRHGIAEPRAERHQRQRVALMHDGADEMEARAEPPAGMEDAEILRREAAAFEERDGERIAEGELHQRRGGGGKAVRASLGRPRHGEHDIGFAGERALSRRGHGDEADLEAAGILDDAPEFRRLARPGQGDDDVGRG